MMFLQFFVWGAWYTTIGNYMSAQGMGHLIQWPYTVNPVAAIVAPFFLGLIADRVCAARRIDTAVAAPGFAFQERRFDSSKLGRVAERVAADVEAVHVTRDSQRFVRQQAAVVLPLAFETTVRGQRQPYGGAITAGRHYEYETNAKQNLVHQCCWYGHRRKRTYNAG